MRAIACLMMAGTLVAASGCAVPASTSTAQAGGHRYEAPDTGSLLGGGGDDTRENAPQLDPGLGGRNGAAGGH